MLLPLAAQASRRAGSGSHAVRFGFARRLSSRSGGRRHSPHGGYGHDVLGDNAGFRPIQSSAAEGIEGIVNHGATSVDSFSSSGFVINGISLAGPVLLLPEQSFMFSPASLQVCSKNLPQIHKAPLQTLNHIRNLPLNWTMPHGLAALCAFSTIIRRP